MVTPTRKLHAGAILLREWHGTARLIEQHSRTAEPCHSKDNSKHRKAGQGDKTGAEAATTGSLAPEPTGSLAPEPKRV